MDSNKHPKITEIEAPPDAKPIAVNGREINPHQYYADNAHETDHIVLTFYDVPTADQNAKLEGLLVELQEDLGSCNYLCRYEPSNLQRLRDLEWVRQVDVYRNIYKIPEELQEFIEQAKKTSPGPSNSVLVNVMPHHELSDSNSLEELAVNIAAKTGINRREIEVLTGKLQARVAVEQIEKIALDGDVRVIEQVLVPDLNDDHANHVVYGPPQRPGLPDFRGKGQVIAVIDTGFDLGTQEDCHPAFEGRIDKLISLGRAKQKLPTEAQRYDDPEGHGTHVCGTIVGHPISTSEGLVGGVAPLAKLVVSSTMIDRRERTPINDIATAFGIPYKEHGARIFSNSWGDNVASTPAGKSQRQYGTDAGYIDAFIRENPEALVIFSAGNNNLIVNKSASQPHLRPAIGSQAAAKNCLTVGASGSTRKVRDPRTELDLLDPDEVYPESSRGPTKEARTKPDVVAPGFSIFSARSRHLEVKYNGFKAVSQDYADVSWQTRSGTSHATPLAAGCAAILREISQSTGCLNPAAALLKAVIVNGADKLPHVDTEAQGFGRINVQASATMLQERPILASEIGAHFQARMESGTLIGDPLVMGGEFVISLALNTQTQVKGLEFKITMVYNDLPGAEVQNNLNLSVIDTGTKEVTHGYKSEDDMKIQNNVEQVVLPSVPLSPLKIRVTAQKTFNGGLQDFTLAWAVLPGYTGTQQATKA